MKLSLMLHHDSYLHGNRHLFSHSIPKTPKWLCLYWGLWPSSLTKEMWQLIGKTLFGIDQTHDFGDSFWTRLSHMLCGSISSQPADCSFCPALLPSWVFSLSQPHGTPWLAGWSEADERWEICRGKRRESLKVGNWRKSQKVLGKKFYQLNWK